MHPLTTLVCGDVPRVGAVGDVFAHLADSLDRLLLRAVKLKEDGDPVALALFGPLLGRATIEVSFTAILGRVDPYRVLAIRRSQLASTFDVKERNPMAFSKKVQRAILCKHFHDLFWYEAFIIQSQQTG